MNLQQLEYFVALTKNEHMTKTAKQLNTSQPNLSYAMNELEKELGVPLIKKVGRNIKLTKYGKMFYQYANQSLNEINNGVTAINEVIHPHYGEINLGFIYTMGAQVVPKCIQQFLSTPENAEINFNLHQGNSNMIIKQLKSETIDIGICSLVEDLKDISFEPFLEQELVLVVANDHPLAVFDEISLKDTMAYPYIYFSETSGLRPHIDSVFHHLNLRPECAMYLEEDHSLLGFISADFGIGILPNIPSISAFPVKKIKISDHFPARSIYIATRKDAFLTPSSQRFKQFLLAEISK